MNIFSRKIAILYICLSLIIILSTCLSACNRDNGSGASKPDDYIHSDTEKPDEKPTESPTEAPTQAHIHTEETIAAIQPTCTEAGLSEGKKCSECGEILLPQTEVAKIAHTPVIMSGKSPTCSEAGLTDGKICSACGEILMPQEQIEKLPHTPADNNASDKETSCAVPRICEVCGQALAPSKQHTPSLSSCAEEQPCAICGEMLIPTNGHILGIPASCTNPQICIVCNRVEVPAFGHTEGEEATCTTAQRCTVCDDVIMPPLGHSFNTEAVTCTNDKYCTVCERLIEKASGHSPSAPATCDTAQICLVCNEILVSSLGHAIVTDTAISATCTTSGLSEGNHCSRCNTVLLAQITIAATGHDYRYSRCYNCADIIKAENVEKSTLPRLDVNTNNVAINSKENYTSATVTLSGCDAKFEFSDASAGIRLRGNSTAVVDKKPYRLKFDAKRSLLGLNDGKKFKSWVLLADYYDSSMLRTFSTFSMAKILNEGKYFSSDFTPVEVYINGEYHGVYLLCEQSQVDGNRVDIFEREDTDTSLEIGYLLIGQGGRTDEPNTVSIGTTLTATDRYSVTMAAGGGNFSISGGDYTPEQIAYVKKYVEAVYEVIRLAVYEQRYYSLDKQGNLTEKTEFTGTTNEEKQIETIDAVFNIDACVRLCILDEIVKNLDAGTYNMYVDLSPTGDGRLTLGPPWDFDFAMANTRYASTHSSTDFYATNFTYSEGMRVNTTFVFFGNLPWFEDMIREIWDDHVDELYAVANNIGVMTAMYGEQYQTDYAYWNRIIMAHHCQTCQACFTCHSDAAEFLQDWLYRRIEWLDYVWGDGEKPPAPPQDERMKFDFTDKGITDYLTAFRRCHGTVTEQGFKIELDQAYDPYFTLDVSKLGESFNAQDYRFIEIEYMIPTTNSYSAYNSIELFLCAGNVTAPTGGISVSEYLVYPDGVYHRIRFDLTSSALWQGEIHSIRIDPFGACEPGDVMYIKSVHFLTE